MQLTGTAAVPDISRDSNCNIQTTDRPNSGSFRVSDAPVTSPAKHLDARQPTSNDMQLDVAAVASTTTSKINNSHVRLRDWRGLRGNHLKSTISCDDNDMFVNYQDSKYSVHSSKTTRLLGSTNNETIPTGDLDTVVVTGNNSASDHKASSYKIVYFFILVSLIVTVLTCLTICGACL